jgi:hypothetical protein
LRWRLRLRVGILARHGEPGDRVCSHDPFAFPDLEVGATSPALRRNYECGLQLDFPALRAGDLDAMALGLIGHGCIDGISKKVASTN